MTAEESILLAHVLGCTRASVLAGSHRAPNDREERALAALRERRAEGYPIAYLLGSAGFYRREFQVDERVLIPRPETEHVVEQALQLLAGRSAPRIFEPGAGSGAIACTIAAERLDARVTGTDVSPGAVAVARENARRLGVADRCRFRVADVAAQPRGRYDVLVANLPYVPSADLPRRPASAAFEPRLALDGGQDGLDLYRRLLRWAPYALVPGGALVMETAPPTAAPLARLAQASFPSGRVRTGKDYAGLDRYVCVELTGQ